ncbi:DUF4097 family beta strand repeat protein [Bacillus aquiflavi]|uniref:DUF4097 domain-containing protein n=1 Tax=Bacillus aquiflavi TaxID=2672567 RepID=A0A6B3VR07_9BACI|nr:DUF4097 family beta strand repeat-containing protein [Bacillus aquiflavi]MBA4536352.1 DUF4097 family beta strand repeat protein [Bacillus aquiflavi]NEY80720.1 DUF4097 domain-containing protein [Bacillus aquiflavi]UAC48048.1 DUF4097 domain-containing protein [Bacillus aquiflavi]
MDFKLDEEKKFKKGKNDLKVFSVLLICAIGIYIIFFKTDFLNAWTFSHSEKEMKITEETKEISIDISSIKATIIPEDRKTIKADLNGSAKLSVKQTDDKIVVKVKHDWWDRWLPFNHKVKLDLYIPESFDQNISLNIGSGSLQYSGSSTKQPMLLNNLLVELGSGIVALEKLSVDHLKVEGSSGLVKIDSLTANKGVFHIGSGSLEARQYAGEIKADVSSGKVHFQMDQLLDSIKMDVSSGIVDLDIPSNANFSFKGKANSGSITCDFPLKSEKSDKKGIEGTHGSGKHEIELDVSSGIAQVY